MKYFIKLMKALVELGTEKIEVAPVAWMRRVSVVDGEPISRGSHFGSGNIWKRHPLPAGNLNLLTEW